MTITDVYEALTSKRPYKKPIPHEKAVEIISSEGGTHFDPALVEIFKAVSPRLWTNRRTFDSAQRCNVQIDSAQMGRLS
jgi:HD-GYP domain-containing protein (c-di-GMP phosphodiesterase class II)